MNIKDYNREKQEATDNENTVREIISFLRSKPYSKASTRLIVEAKKIASETKKTIKNLNAGLSKELMTKDAESWLRYMGFKVEKRGSFSDKINFYGDGIIRRISLTDTKWVISSSDVAGYSTYAFNGMFFYGNTPKEAVVSCLKGYKEHILERALSARSLIAEINSFEEKSILKTIHGE